jgi:hypothetical protein
MIAICRVPALLWILSIGACRSTDGASEDLGAGGSDGSSEGAGAPSLAGQCNASGAGGSPANPPVTSYRYDSVWGPCIEDKVPCEERYVALVDGSLTFIRGDVVQETELGTADHASLREFLADEALAAAVTDAAPCSCSKPFDWTETLTLEFEGSSATVSKEVTACEGAPYDEMRQFVGVFRTYFDG